MRYAVTGATGFVGGRVAQHLRQRGDDVVALVRDRSKAGQLRAAGVELVDGDVTDPLSLPGLLDGVDGLFHVAGWYKIGVPDSSAAEAVNVRGTRNVLEAARRSRVPRFVHTSSLAINSDTHGRMVDESYRFTGKHLSEYDRTKAAAHRIAHEFLESGLPGVVVMPGLVYGPADTSTLRPTLRQAMAGRLPAVPGRTAYCWSHVDDIAWAHLRAMDVGRVGEDYIIAGPAHTLSLVMRAAADWAGARHPITVPPELFSALAPISAVVSRVAPLPDTYRPESLRVLAGVTYLGSNDKARRELDYNPRPLRVGLFATLEREASLAH